VGTPQKYAVFIININDNHIYKHLNPIVKIQINIIVDNQEF